MNIEVELAFEVVGSEFTEVSFIPRDNVGASDSIQASEEGESCQNDGSNDRLPASKHMEEWGGLSNRFNKNDIPAAKGQSYLGARFLRIFIGSLT